ncbi:MAG: DNA integrity scanning protein DisA nucleotide-binding domain protein [Deltaproteobacteria bacterium]|nr:DNA integrity scanning protein DisA nucleotide-binding domain protein [Deltaproteobacteria bacterium]
MAGSWIEVRLVDVLDVALVSIFLYLVIVWMRQARAGLPLVGIAILGGVYLAARQLDLHLTAWIFQGFFAIFVIILVVIFQRELRQLFERIAVFGMLRRNGTEASADVQACLVRSVLEFQRQGIGALIVVCGRESVERHLEGGVALDGRLSDALLASLFDPHSVGHDGALVVSGDRIVMFSAQLPLSSDFSQIGSRGTRHSAALGLAERTDALCIVVSEERGTISIARDGALREIAGHEALESELRDFVALGRPGVSRRQRWLRGLRQHWVERIAAVVLTAGLWAAFVPGSQVLEEELTVPIRVENVPAGFALDRTDPTEARIELSGTRRDFFLLDPRSVEVRIDASAIGMGRRSFELDREDIEMPAGFSLVAVRPSRVRLSVRAVPLAPDGAPLVPEPARPAAGSGGGNGGGAPRG